MSGAGNERAKCCGVVPSKRLVLGVISAHPSIILYCRRGHFWRRGFCLQGASRKRYRRRSGDALLLLALFQLLASAAGGRNRGGTAPAAQQADAAVSRAQAKAKYVEEITRSEGNRPAAKKSPLGRLQRASPRAASGNFMPGKFPGRPSASWPHQRRIMLRRRWPPRAHARSGAKSASEMTLVAEPPHINAGIEARPQSPPASAARPAHP